MKLTRLLIATTLLAASSAQAVEPVPFTELLPRVLAHDPQVRVAEAQLGIWRARYQQARSRLFPTLNVRGQRGQGVDEEFGLPIDRHTNQADATLSLNLYNAGADRAELRGADIDQAAAEADLRRAREEVAERLALAYADLQRYQTLLEPAQARRDEVAQLTEKMREQNRAGKVSDIDLAQAEALYADGEINQGQLTADYQAARAHLEALAGEAIPATLPLPDLPGWDAAGLDSGTLRAAQLRAQAQRARVLPSVSAVSPRLDLSYAKQLSNRTVPLPTTVSKSGWLLTLSWQLPLGGETIARRNEGERRAEASEAEADRLQQQARAETETLPARIAQSERSLALLESQQQRYAQMQAGAAAQFDAGRRTLPQLIQLVDARYNVRQRLVDERFKLASNRLRALALSGTLLPALGYVPAGPPPTADFRPSARDLMND